MKHICGACNYETHDLSHFNRHKKSIKHLKNESKSDTSATFMQHSCNIYATQKNTEKEIECDEGYVCDFCFKNFKYHQSMYRHMKYHCKSKNASNNELIDKINEITIEKNNLKKENNKLLNLATDNAIVAKKSMSVMGYALKNYNNAPPIKLLEDDKVNNVLSKLLIYDDNGKKRTEKSIEEVILFHHKQSTLSKILGDLIVRIYKKSDPSKQSLWSSDVTRLTFIVRDIIGNSKQSKWIVDKKGIHFTETIVDPLMEKIKELLTDYNEKCGNCVRNITKKSNLDGDEESEIKNILAVMQEINLTLLTIKLRKIHMDILKYVAPYFNLNVNNT
jgi:hypothetical protein